MPTVRHTPVSFRLARFAKRCGGYAGTRQEAPGPRSYCLSVRSCSSVDSNTRRANLSTAPSAGLSSSELKPRFSCGYTRGQEPCPVHRDMSTDKPMGTNPQRYEAALRINEVIAACREPEELARALAHRLDDFLNFDYLYLAVLKENSREIESFVWGKGPTGWPTTLPVEELPLCRDHGPSPPAFEAFESQDPTYVPDWNTEQRFPLVKAWATTKGFKLGSTIDVPLTTPHRRLGTFGIGSHIVTSYSPEDVSFLGLIGRVGRVCHR